MEYRQGTNTSVVEPKWRDEGGIIHCSVLSRGTTGEKWIEHFEHRGGFVCSETKKILLSPRFIPTLGVKTDLAIFKSTLLPSNERYTISAHEIGLAKGLAIPEIEVTILLREKFSNKELEEMGLWWIAVMHAPVRSFEDSLISLCVDRYGDKEWICAHGAKDYDSWNSDGGFAYKIPS